jgi:glycosyltransferase involved in cell wall biosynthesis
LAVSALKILVHDWSGHPFQIALSREFARRGHNVIHAYFKGVQGPKGPMERQPSDPPNFRIMGRTMPEPYAKYDFIKRWLQERNYGRELARFILSERPDVVLSSNTPLDVQNATLKAVRFNDGVFVFWLQDILSVAMTSLLHKKLPFVGPPVARYYSYVERSLLKQSDHVICICDDFVNFVKEWGVAPMRCSVIENWASREEIIPVEKNNAWCHAHGLMDKIVFLYAGTLSIKHDPEKLLRLAQSNASNPNFKLVVASEGVGADWLKQQCEGVESNSITVLPFQPYEALSEMLGSADVLVALIEPDAAKFSVPSKVLSYMAAGRAILVSAPMDSFVARLVENVEAGLAVSPDASYDFVNAAMALVGQVELRKKYAANARRYAEEKFDQQKIANRFLSIFEEAMERRPLQR